MKKITSLVLCLIVLFALVPSALAWEPLKRGEDSTRVMKMQQRLIHLGYLTGKADGNFGKQTESAVKVFQKQCDLPVTGVVDKDTLKRMGEHTAPYAPGTTPPPIEPTPAPIVEDGYIFSTDRRIKVPRNPVVLNLSGYDNYRSPVITYASVKSNLEGFSMIEVSVSDLFNLANKEDMAHDIACRTTMVEQLTDGVYFVHYDLYLGEASLPYTQVIIIADQLPDEFENGDLINIQSGIPLIKRQLKNPNSMILRSVNARNYEENGSILYECLISAQNGFGGYGEVYINIVYNGNYGIMQAYDNYNSWMRSGKLTLDTDRQYSFQ